MNGNQNQDIFSISQENIDKVFTSVKHTVPQYHQSITNLQQEYLQYCEDVCNSVLAIQKEYTDKTGFKPFIPATILKLFSNGVDEFDGKNQFALISIDATQQGIKNMHDNTKLFTELHKNFVLPWVTMFFKKN